MPKRVCSVIVESGFRSDWIVFGMGSVRLSAEQQTFWSFSLIYTNT